MERVPVLQMPRTKTHPSQLGKVVNIDNKFCARFQPRDFGQARDFTGPSHDNEKRATEDLTAIRSAGAEHATRMGALTIYINISPQGTEANFLLLSGARWVAPSFFPYMSA